VQTAEFLFTAPAFDPLGDQQRIVHRILPALDFSLCAPVFFTCSGSIGVASFDGEGSFPQSDVAARRTRSVSPLLPPRLFQEKTVFNPDSAGFDPSGTEFTPHLVITTVRSPFCEISIHMHLNSHIHSHIRHTFGHRPMVLSTMKSPLFGSRALAFTIVPVGEFGVGKTALRKWFCDRTFEPEAAPAVGLEFGRRTTRELL
jgi:hypothetical protein